MIVTVVKVNRTCAVETDGFNVCATRQQFVDDVELPSHHGPVDRLIGSLVSDMQQFRRIVEQTAHFGKVVRGSPPRPPLHV